MKIWSLILTLVMVMASVDAEAARRMGGGRSFGKQSSNVTQREATPASPAAPTQNATNSAVKPAGAAPAAATAPKHHVRFAGDGGDDGHWLVHA